MNELHDPQIAGLVTKIVEMAPDAPAYPETVIAKPVPSRRFPNWVWAPAAAAAVMLIMIPIALRSGWGDDPFPVASSPNTSTTVIAQTNLAGNDSIDSTSPAPAVEAERNTLVLGPNSVEPGGRVVINFSAGSNVARSELYWMDRFDYTEQAWISEWVLWSNRADGGIFYAQSAIVTVLIPEPNLTDDGPDAIQVPPGSSLGTYRVCVSVPNGACGLLEVTDADASAPVTTLPPFDDEVTYTATPDFARVIAVPGDGVLIATPYQFLTGSDAVLVAIADGFITHGETLANGFYLKPLLGGNSSKLVPAPQFAATVLDPNDPSVEVILTFDEWVSWVAPKPGGAPGSLAEPEMWAYLTYDALGRVLTLKQQYLP